MYSWIQAVLAGILAIVVSPVLFFIASIVYLSDGAPILFRHKRVGMGGKSIDVYKFRTMYMDSEGIFNRVIASDPMKLAEWEDNRKLVQDPRVYPLGSLLRKFSLDELPQLFNVIKGDMNLVGPRAVTEGELVKYGEHAHLLLSVKPGITGLWQISGRSQCSYEQRVALDIEYLRSRSVLKDLEILLKTPVAVLKSTGAF